MTAQSAKFGGQINHQTTVRLVMIEDDKYYVEFVRQLLIHRSSPKFEIRAARTLQEAVGLLQDQIPDVILLDLNLPDGKGLVSLNKIKEYSESCPIVILTSADDDSLGLQAVCAGAQDYLVKQAVGNDSLVRCIRYAIERHRAEEQKLKLALIQDFVATLAHDMSVPLIGADKLLDAMLAGSAGSLTVEQSKLIQTLKESNHSQLGLVKRLLEIYRYESGTAELSFTRLDVPHLIEKAIEGCRAQFSGSIIFENAATMPAFVFGDEEALARLFTDLIKNATTFSTKDKQITLSLSCPDNNVTIAVHNFGEAIPQDAQNVLFQKFWQGVPGKSYVAHTGLGLYLCHRIVQLHHGRIACHSTTAEGTTITVTLPRQH